MDTFYEEPTTTTYLEDLFQISSEKNQIMTQSTSTEGSTPGILNDNLELPQGLGGDFPPLFDKVTPNRIHHMLHELTTSKGIDGVYVSRFKNFKYPHYTVRNEFSSFSGF